GQAGSSPPRPNPGLPGFGRLKICRKRASPQPAGEGRRLKRVYARLRRAMAPGWGSCGDPLTDPHPQPLPTRGRGVHRVCGVILMPRDAAQPLWAGVSVSAFASGRFGFFEHAPELKSLGIDCLLDRSAREVVRRSIIRTDRAGGGPGTMALRELAAGEVAREGPQTSPRFRLENV